MQVQNRNTLQVENIRKVLTKKANKEFKGSPVEWDRSLRPAPPRSAPSAPPGEGATPAEINSPLLTCPLKSRLHT